MQAAGVPFDVIEDAAFELKEVVLETFATFIRNRVELPENFDGMVASAVVQRSQRGVLRRLADLAFAAGFARGCADLMGPFADLVRHVHQAASVDARGVPTTAHFRNRLWSETAKVSDAFVRAVCAPFDLPLAPDPPEPVAPARDTPTEPTIRTKAVTTLPAPPENSADEEGKREK